MADPREPFPNTDRELIEAAAREASGPARNIAAAGDPVGPGPKLPEVPGCSGLRELRRGGQGVVYEAWDDALGRKVAIKVLREVPGDDARQRARLDREIALLSRLRHPNIVALHRAGTTAGGLAYFVMDFVDGLGIDAHVRTFELEVPAVLSLFEKLCAGVQAAHAAGIIHRDLKPANILVDEAGEPRILDFGLAREEAGGLTTLTETGDVFGTPAYMSPEQLGGGAVRPDHRTDVWSLGVTLYECLTGQRPFEAATREQLFRRIRLHDAEDPRRLNRAIRPDLRLVLATALEKEPDARYHTASDFAEDLRRVRESLPVRARPLSWRRRVRRWIRRSPARASVVLLLAFGIPVVAGLGGYLWARWPDLERVEVQRREEAVERELERGFQLLGELSPTAAAAAFEKALSEDPGRPIPEALAGLLLALRQQGRTDEALAVPVKFRGRGGDAPALLHLIAATRTQKAPPDSAAGSPGTQADAPDSLTRFVLGLEAFEEARHGDDEALTRSFEHFTRAAILAPRSRALHHFQRIQSAALLGRREECIEGAALLINRWPESATALTYSALALLATEVRAGGLVTHFRLREKGEASPTGPLKPVRNREPDPAVIEEVEDRLRRALAKDDGLAIAHGLLGQVRGLRGDHAQELTSLRRSVDLDPGSARARNGLGIALWNSGELAAAAEEFRRAVTLDPRWSLPRVNLAQILSDAGDNDEALAEARAAVGLASRGAPALSVLGGILAARGAYAEAETQFQRATEAEPDNAAAWSNLATAQLRQGRLRESADAFRRSIAADPELAHAHRGLAGVLRKLGDHAGSAESLRRALDLDAADVEARLELGEALFSARDFTGAAQALRGYLSVRPGSAQARSTLAAALVETGEGEAALTEAEAAVRLDPGSAAARVNLAGALLVCGRTEEAAAAFRAAIGLDPTLAPAHFNLGLLHHRAGEHDRASEAYERALALDSGFVDAVFGLGLIAESKGDCEAAIARQRTVLVSAPGHAGAHRQLVNLLRAKEDHEGLEAELSRWTALRKDDAEAWHLLAVCRLAAATAQGRTFAPGATSAARQAVTLGAEKDPRHLLTLAEALLLDHDDPAARAAATKARDLVLAGDSDPGLRSEIQRFLRRIE